MKAEQPKTARNKRIIKAHRKGDSFRVIAEREGISFGRAYKIWVAYRDRF